MDSSVLVALLNLGDLWHERAVALSESLLGADATVIYFDCAVIEAVSAAARRLHEKGRGADVKVMLERLNKYAPPDDVTWILPEVPRLYLEALDLIRSRSGELNFNDALIALACREREIGLIASFDPDFDRLPWLKRVGTPSDIPSA